MADELTATQPPLAGLISERGEGSACGQHNGMSAMNIVMINPLTNKQ